MKELGVRALSGAVYVALVLGAAFLGDLAVAVLFLPLCAIAAWELARLLDLGGARGVRTSWSAIHASLMYLGHVAAYFQEWASEHLLGIAAALIVIDTIRLLVSGVQDPGRALGATLLALLLGSSFGCTVSFFAIDAWLFIGFMLLLWTNDTGAYLVGRTFGRTKLMPSVSPKKTVEGLVGGILFTIGVAGLIARWQTVLDPWQWIVCAIVVAATSTLGDLLESALKRTKGVKDSGSIMPGHGGILDRFDGFLFAAPSMLIAAMLMLMR